MKILLIDNYDSFTYNLFQGLKEAGADEVIVIKNNEKTLEEIKDLNSYDGVVLSPGPGTVENPKDIGVSQDVLDFYRGRCPILGVCLGHQLIGYYFGGQVDLVQPEHAKIWDVTQKNKSLLFKDLPDTFSVARYHSMVLSLDTFPDDLLVTSTSRDGCIMSIEHKKYSMFGVQFHPESIGTDLGAGILRNFIDICRKEKRP